jgi:hypothetical protein
VVVLLLSSASLLLLPLFLFFLVFLLLFLTVQGCFNDGEDGAVVAVERKHSGGAQVVRNGPSSPLCGDHQSLFFSSSLFCFGFSSVAAGGSADGGGMAVLDGGGRRPRWRERSSCWEPEKDNFVF